MSEMVERVKAALLEADHESEGLLTSLEAERFARAAIELVREAVLAIVREQPDYPDTHTGMRQQWVKDQIAAKIDAALKETSDAD